MPKLLDEKVATLRLLALGAALTALTVSRGFKVEGPIKREHYQSDARVFVAECDSFCDLQKDGEFAPPCTRATLTVLTQERTVCAGVKVEGSFRGSVPASRPTCVQCCGSHSGYTLRDMCRGPSLFGSCVIASSLSFTSSLASYFEKLRPLSTHDVPFSCTCWVHRWLPRESKLRTIVMGLHVHDVRVLPSCVRPPSRVFQRVRWPSLRCKPMVHQHRPMCPPRVELTGVACLLPTPSWTQRVLQVRTRLRVASDWLLTEQDSRASWCSRVVFLRLRCFLPSRVPSGLPEKGTDTSASVFNACRDTPSPSTNQAAPAPGPHRNTKSRRTDSQWRNPNSRIGLKPTRSKERYRSHLFAAAHTGQSVCQRQHCRQKLTAQ